MSLQCVILGHRDSFTLPLSGNEALGGSPVPVVTLGAWAVSLKPLRFDTYVAGVIGASEATKNCVKKSTP